MLVPIKYRGKRKSTCEWVYGPLIANMFGTSICCNDGEWLGVIPESTGIFIGSKDCNGTEIYTGDIIRMNKELYIIDYVQRYHRYAPTRKGVFFASFDPAYVEVVGNVTDFPQMAEEIMNKDHDKFSPPAWLIEERNNSGLIEE